METTVTSRWENEIKEYAEKHDVSIEQAMEDLERQAEERAHDV